jgi:uncharacterized protein (DUF924 family)
MTEALLDPVAERLIAFWFEGANDGVNIPPGSAISKRWFAGTPELDQTLRTRFGAEVERALNGALDAWAETPRGALALVLLLDQLTRNIYRGTARAFAGDARAQEIVLAALSSKTDRALGLYERSFFYLPLMHAESLALHDQATREYAALLEDARAAYPDATALFEGNVAYEAMHRAIILRFGRYPHRNKTLGRPSTAEELEFLEQPGSSF